MIIELRVTVLPQAPCGLALHYTSYNQAVYPRMYTKQGGTESRSQDRYPTGIAKVHRHALWSGSRWVLRLGLLSLLATLPVQAQSHMGDLALSTQAQVDTFAYTEVTGTLHLEGFDITNLDSLSVLTSVGETLWITNNPVLTDLDGLSSLTSVGGLAIDDNPMLMNLDGLNGLTSVEREVPVVGGVGTIGGPVRIRGNAALTSLNGLSNLSRVGGLGVVDNAALTSLDGLSSSLTALEANLSIIDNPVLTSLNGLSSLTAVRISLNITGNPVLTSLDGLSGLTDFTHRKSNHRWQRGADKSRWAQRH